MKIYVIAIILRVVTSLDSSDFTGKEELKTSNKHTCVTKKLTSNQRLNPGEFICTGKDDEYRFGLEMSGEPIQYIEGDVDWKPSKWGSYLSIHKDVNIVLKDDNDKPVWASGCYAANSYLSFDEEYPVSHFSPK